MIRRIFYCSEKIMKREDYEIQTTEDGSTTIWLKDMDEHYHSVKGALTEANHIYRDAAFKHRHKGEMLRLLEIGFGTGLNTVVTAMEAYEGRPVHYISLEKYPLDSEVLTEMHYDAVISAELWQSIHQAEWNKAVQITPYFTLEKRCADFLTDELPHGIDVVYFDAFAPEKQPEMWGRQTFERLYEVMNPGAILTTYCAKGAIRRLLQDVGFIVERIPGPPGGKREILRATKKQERC